jgi:hypothetical protein
MSLVENIVIEHIVDKILEKISNNVFKDRVLPVRGSDIYCVCHSCLPVKKAHAIPGR